MFHIGYNMLVGYRVIIKAIKKIIKVRRNNFMFFCSFVS